MSKTSVDDKTKKQPRSLVREYLEVFCKKKESSKKTSKTQSKTAPEGKKPEEKTQEKYTLNRSKVSGADPIDTGKIDQAVNYNALESDRDYRRITERIIEITDDQLYEQTTMKKPLRIILMVFIILLLSAQFAALVIVLLFNSAKGLNISDYVINVYIVSVFVETLAGLQIMIKFAFDSKQEIDLIEILNSIVQHFKKYDEK